MILNSQTGKNEKRKLMATAKTQMAEHSLVTRSHTHTQPTPQHHPQSHWWLAAWQWKAMQLARMTPKFQE